VTGAEADRRRRASGNEGTALLSRLAQEGIGHDIVKSVIIASEDTDL
jgi:hypothetical protein